MSSQLGLDYEAALRAYLKNPDESALEAAYELGRVAMRNGTGIIDLVGAHADALRSIRGSSQAATFLRSNAFLIECLAPLDMARQGFMEAIKTLQTRNAELQRTNLNLESFARSLAHDLRTPLRAVAGYSAVLVEGYGDSLGDAGRDYAERIAATSEQIGRVLDAMLQQSTIARAKIDLQPVDLGAETARVAAGLQRHDPERRVHLTIQQPAWVLADRTLIRTALQNLMDNAWKFTSGQANASIDFGMTPSEDGHVCCHVRDNGAGFDPAYVNKLFTLFERLHTTSEFSGAGVGLAAVRQIIELHGGRAWADGAVGAGAIFSFTLPAADPE